MFFGDQLGISAKAHPAAGPGQLAAAHHWHSWESRGARLTAQKNAREIILMGGTKYTRCPLRCQEACGLGKARDGILNSLTQPRTARFFFFFLPLH